MAVRLNILHVEKPAALARHLLRPTELPEEQAAQQGYQMDAAAGMRRGSVPRVQADMPIEVQQATGLNPRRTPSRQALTNVLSGLRADGEPLKRSAKAASSESRRTHVVLVTTSPHISFSIMRALSKTEAARSLMDSALRRANGELMAHAEREILGWTRRGAQGKAGEEQGRVGRIEVDHFTTRQTMDGRAAPMSHIENVVLNAVVTKDGHLGAINLRRIKGRVQPLEGIFQQALHRNLKAMGAKVEMRDGTCILTDVPDPLCKAMSRRTEQAEANARAYLAKTNPAADFDALTPRARAKLIKAGAQRTQRTNHDAIGDRGAWEREAAVFGYTPRDAVFRPPPAKPMTGSLLERSATLKRAAVETMQTARQMAESQTSKVMPSILEAMDRHKVRNAVEDAIDATRQAARDSRPVMKRILSKSRMMAERTAVMLRPVTQEIARRVGAEADLWAKKYRLATLARVGAAVIRWGTAKTQEPQEKKAVLPVAKRNTQIRKATAPVPETPIERRSREIREAALKTAAEAPAVMSTPASRITFVNARAAAVMQALADGGAQAAGEAKVVAAPSAPTQEKPTPVRATHFSRPRRAFTAEQEAEIKAARAIELEEIRNGLRNTAGALAERLLGKPDTRTGSDWRWGTHGSLKVTVGGQNRGLWHDHEAHRGGDMLELIREQTGLPFGKAVSYAREYLGMSEPKLGGERMNAHDRVAMAAHAKRLAEQRAKEDAEHAAAKAARHEVMSRRATIAWEGSKPATDAHPYLKAKGVPAHGERLDRRGRLRIALQDHDGKVWSLQHIQQHRDGTNTKLFLRTARAAGLFSLVGTTMEEAQNAKAVAFSEGRATGISVHMATGLPVVVTFSVGNKEQVMKEWRERHPHQMLIDAADNDHQKEELNPPKLNAGKDMAMKLHADIGAVPALPPFMRGDAGKDWNDYVKANGLDQAREAMRHSVRAVMPQRSVRDQEDAYAARLSRRPETTWREVPLDPAAAKTAPRKGAVGEADQGQGV